MNVRFFSTLRNLTGKVEETLELQEGDTVATALATLSKKYGYEFDNYLFENGAVKSYLYILLDGLSIDVREGLKTRLVEGSTLAILDVIAGGSGPPIKHPFNPSHEKLEQS